MSDQVSDHDDALRKSHGLTVQNQPKANSRESAHDMVIKDLTAGRLYLGISDTGLELLYAKIADAYVSIARMLDVSPVGTMQARKEFGLEKYGTVLQPFNNRNQLADSLDELGDALVYIRCAIEEEMESHFSAGKH